MVRRDRLVRYTDDDADAYESGRQLGGARLEAWLSAIDPWLESAGVSRLLDVGAGTGRFAGALASRYQCEVIALEPSEAMLRKQRDKHAPGVSLIQARAEQIPLKVGCVEGAFLSYVWHQIADRDEAARELHRVLTPGAVVLLRTNFADDFPNLWWYEHFPQAREADAAQYQSRSETLALFERAGLTVQANLEVTTTTAVSRRADLARLRARPLSFFSRMDDAEIKRGFDRILKTVEPADLAKPATIAQSLVVLRAS